MDRFPDWPERLHRAIRLRLASPFVWGENDCATYTADLIAAQTGEDFAAGLRGRYGSREEAEALLRARGWGDLAGLADAHLPRRDGRPLRGDVVLLPGLEGAYLAVSVGGRLATAPDETRSRVRHIDGLIAAWAVG